MLIAILAKTIAKIIDIYQYIIMFRIILSWFPQSQFIQNRFIAWIFMITDPVLNKFREWFAFLRLGMIDFSPLILYFSLELLKKLFLNLFMAHQLAVVNF